MNEEFRELDRRPANIPRDSLVERLDPALGEASSGIGVLLSELVRRTLRGGVSKIEEEMHDFVEEKVDQSVQCRMPAFQEAATRTAERKAEEIARQEVQTVEKQAREAAERLSQELVESQRQAEEAARRLEEEARQAAERLAQEIVQTEQRVEEKARVITQEAVHVVEQESKAATEKLTHDLAETERRAEIRARELVAEHVEELKQKSKSTYLQVRESLDSLAASTSAFESKLLQEQHNRESSLAQLRTALEGSLQTQVQDLRNLVQELNGRNTLLELRIAELEKPRGLRAWFGKLFGRKRAAAPAPAATPHIAEPSDG